MGISLGMAGVALAFYGFATFRQDINPVDPGPAFYPRLVSLLLLAFAVLQLWVSWQARGPARAEGGPAGAGGAPYRYSLGTCAASIAYVALFDKLNYVASGILLLGALMLLGGVRRWPVLVGVPLGYAILTYLLFGKLLMVPLP
jgi:hypothetical protein